MKSVLPFFVPCKSIITIHDLASFRFPKHYPFFWKLYWSKVIKYGAQTASHIITPSHSAAKDVSNFFGIPGKRITVIYPPIDVKNSYYPRNNNEILKLKQELGLPVSFILYVGNLTARKNLEGLIQAFYICKHKYNISEKLVIAGAVEWAGKRIFGLVNKYGLDKEVRFCGYVPENSLPVLYSAARLFVYPSFYEGFGFPILEAMACGCPVVASNVSSIPEISGDSAILVDPNNTALLSTAIINVLADEKLRNGMISRGIEHIKKFTKVNIAKNLVDVYEKIAKG